MGLSLKLSLLSATVVSATAATVMNLDLSDLPIIWASIISWLKPPYLYFLINGIIITIVASSRLQSKLEASDHHSLSSFPTPAGPAKAVLPVEPPPPVHEPDALETEPVDIAVDAGYGTTRVVDETLDEDMKIAKEAYEEIKKNRVSKSVISMSTWTPMKTPPATARFSRRKPAKAPEGGRALGVAKPKRQDTLESTWKTITDGRSVPLTRHLRKSDTWETRENRNSNGLLTDGDHPERMTKSETFDANRSRKPVRPPPAPSKLSRAGGSGRLKKEPSLGQEELNRRVEAFIKKFNEDMRLQRQESLNQYMEMINRGAH